MTWVHFTGELAGQTCESEVIETVADYGYCLDHDRRVKRIEEPKEAPWVVIEPYSGMVATCTYACDNTPEWVVTRNGRNDPGYKQVACSAHVGDLAGNMVKSKDL